MKTIEGFIYVGFAETTALYSVRLLDGDPLTSAQSETVSGIIVEPGLAYSPAPLWFALKNDNMRYEIRVFEDRTCEISHRW